MASPSASTSRLIKSGFIYNADSASVTVIIEYYDGTNARQIAEKTIAVGDALVFGDAGFVSGGGDASATWGGIIGTLADQTDLQAALTAAQLAG